MTSLDTVVWPVLVILVPSLSPCPRPLKRASWLQLVFCPETATLRVSFRKIGHYPTAFPFRPNPSPHSSQLSGFTTAGYRLCPGRPCWYRLWDRTFGSEFRRERYFLERYLAISQWDSGCWDGARHPRNVRKSLWHRQNWQQGLSFYSLLSYWLSKAWNELEVPKGDQYAWDSKSTYIQSPPFFETMERELPQGTFKLYIQRR